MELDVIRQTITLRFEDVYKRLNYLLAISGNKNTQTETDLSKIEKQIEEIFSLLNSLDLNGIDERLDSIDKKLNNLSLKIDVNSANIDKILPLIEDWDDKGLTSLLIYVNNNIDDLKGLINLYEKLVASGFKYETFEYYAENVEKVKQVLSSYDLLKDAGISVSELVSQLNFMKSYMEIEDIKNAYYDLINSIASITPPNLLEFEFDQFPTFITNYNALPSNFDDIKDLTAIENSCIQLELQRNLILNSNDSVIFREKSKNVEIQIIRLAGSLEYSIIFINGSIYTHNVKEFQVINSSSISQIPNFSNHILFFEYNQLKDDFTISILTGKMDLTEKVIRTELIIFPTNMSRKDYVQLISDLPQFATAYVSYQSMISTNEFTYFKNIYICAVLMNIVYQTELDFNEQYTNQVINNLYGQSTAIALSKAMKEIGATTRIREVQYKMSTPTQVKYKSYVDEVTSFINSLEPVPIDIKTMIIRNNTTHITDFFTKKNIAMETLSEQNGRYFTNSSKTIFYNSAQKIPITQAYESESFQAECWLEEEWIQPEVISFSNKESVIMDSSNTLLDCVSSIGVGLVGGTDINTDKYHVTGLQVSVNTLEEGDYGEKIPEDSYWGVQTVYRIKTYPRIVLYIKTNNLSGDSTNSISGIVRLNDTSYDAELFPYLYDDGTHVIKVYRGVITTLTQATRILNTFGGFEFKQNTGQRNIRINSYYDSSAIYDTVTTPYYSLPILKRLNDAYTDIEPQSLVLSMKDGWSPQLNTTSVSISPKVYDSDGFGTLTEYGAMPQVLTYPGVHEENVFMTVYADKKYQSTSPYAQSYFGNNNAKLTGTGVTESLTVPCLKHDDQPHGDRYWTNYDYTSNCYPLVGQVILTPPIIRGYTGSSAIELNSITLKGEEITTPVQFNQLTIPDYILKMQYDIAYLNAYAEYLTALIDQLDQRVTLVEDTLDQVIETINNIMSALSPDSKSIGGQILGFIGTSVGMFFPLTGLAISIVGQVYEGVVELKKGNLLVGIMDITTGAIMSALGIRKYRQRMERKYGAVEIKQDPLLPTYDELFGPPGYGSSNVKPNNYIGRPNESPQVKGGTLRNTMIFNDTPGQFILLTWLYRTTYGYQSEARDSDYTPEVRMLRVRERWGNAQNGTLTFDYMKLRQTEQGIDVTTSTQSQFATDFDTTLSIQTLGKLLFAKTRSSIVKTEGTGFDSEIFEAFALSTASLNPSMTSKNRILPLCYQKYKIIHDSVVPKVFSGNAEPLSTLSINDLYKGLDADLSNEDSQIKIFNSVYKLLTL